MAKDYKYARPANGQIEERWWAKLPDQERVRLLGEVRKGLELRRDRWNATHPPCHQIPRPFGHLP